LFITKQIVQLHRGKLWVESQEGAGACFFVELR
jgi:two-component system sensor histidine kinase VicK